LTPFALKINTTVPLVNVTKLQGDFTTNDIFNFVQDFYRFTGFWQNTHVLQPGVGYWVKFSQQVTLEFRGPVFTQTTQQVSFVSNQLTPFALMLNNDVSLSTNFTLTTNAFTTNDIFNFVTDFYRYTGSWQNTHLLRPGIGYWTKFNQDVSGTLA
jgi:hypothetical protein